MRIVLEPYNAAIFDGELPSHQLAAVHALYSYGGKIQAIKWLRAAYPGTSLRSAKTAVEDLINHYRWLQVPIADDGVRSLGSILSEALSGA